MLFSKKKEAEKGLVDAAFDEAVQMLQMGQQMFALVTNALVETSVDEDIAKISTIDKEINKLHRNVRKKIFEHLSISGGRDLFSSLVLLSVVNDLERIGDYNKNIADIIEMIPTKLDLGEYDKPLKKLYKETDNFFNLTLSAFGEEDEKSAKAVLKKYRQISRTCDGLLRKMFEENQSSKKVNKDLIAFVLLIRYFKRLNAHLKNIASTVVNPFHRIGYRQKKKYEN
ncbi:MAG: DUF47 family protein [Calditrichaeota bacterium]|nr:DUF47 family protein [Calditrichota bacterium]